MLAYKIHIYAWPVEKNKQMDREIHMAYIYFHQEYCQIFLAQIGEE